MEPAPTPKYATVTAAVIAAGALLAAATGVDAPGLTIDEPINLGHGLTITDHVFEWPRTLFTAEGVRAVWENGHEHPPLTRFLIGVGERQFAPPRDLGRILNGPGNLHGGRMASACAYAGIVFLVVRNAAALGGLFAGAAAGLATAILPRLFGHAHLASPEVLSAVFMLWAWVAAGKALLTPRPTTFGWLLGIVAAGVLLGLALLTKLTAVLVPFTVIIAAIAVRGKGAIPGLVLWSLVGGFVFFAGWPWLWPVDLPGQPAGFAGSIHRLQEFVATGSKRAAIYVWYFGRQYAGNITPWHFAPIFFLITTPVVTLLAGGAGLWRAIQARIVSPRLFLIAVAFLGSLAVFCFPVQRYDGERLFLFVFPLWGVLAGVGTAWVVNQAPERWKWPLGALALGLLATPARDVYRLRPCALSYYNSLVGGLPGAERLGLEPTYWGDSLTPKLLDELAAAAQPNDLTVLAPTLYSGHAACLSSPGMAAKQIRVVAADQVLPPGADPPPDADPGEEVRWGIVYHRTGYLIDPIPSQLEREGEVVSQETRDGVWLARVVRLPPGWRVVRPVR